MDRIEHKLPSTAADTSEPKTSASECLWCIHIEGLGDYIAAGSREGAEEEAAAINVYLDSFQNGQRATSVRAVAIEWPFTPASHARSLEEDWNDVERMPHRRRMGIGQA